jgi:hypothetical protein
VLCGYYSPFQEKYIRVHPDIDLEELRKDDDDYVLTTSMWVYSNKAGIMKYSTLEDYFPLDKRPLYSGWNFYTITPEMEDVFIESGSCGIEKLVIWEHQAWDVITEEELEQVGMDYERFSLADHPGDVGKAVVVKVSGDCFFDYDGGVEPPPLPSDSNTPLTSQECTDLDGFVYDPFGPAGSTCGQRIGSITDLPSIEGFWCCK